MTGLFTSIFARFNGTTGGAHNALYGLVGGRLFNTGAPAGTPLPLVAMSLVSNDPDQIMERCTVQFSIYSSRAGDTEVLAIYEALTDLYDNCDLPSLGVSGNLGMERSHCALYGDEGTWHYVVQYEVWVTRK